MMEHDMHVGELLALLDELGIAENTIVYYSTDNGPHFNTWPDAGYTPFRKEKNSNWEGAYRVPAFVRWPSRYPSGVTLNGLVAHEDWMPTFASAAGKSDLKEDMLDGYRAIGRNFRQHLDGYDMNDYFANADEYETFDENISASPRKEFFYVNDDG
jgi:arylsulfatase